MPREFTLPDVGEGVAEGEIVEWLVAEGDAVTEDQPVAEVETDKAVVEVPSPVNGTVQTLHYEEGDVVEVGSVIVTFAVEGEDAEAPEAAESAGESAGTEGTTGAAEGAPGEPEDAGEAAPEAGEPSVPGAKRGGRTFASPSVRRLARERGVDLAAVEGSGPGGRITEGDIGRAAEGGGATETAVGAADGREAAGGDARGPAGEGAGSPDRREESPTREPAERGGEAAERGGEAAVRASAAGVEAAGRERTLAAPATRRLAEELGVDLDDVPASEQREDEDFVGPDDVRAYAEAQRAAKEAQAAEVATGETGEREERVPYRGVRRTIGRQMATSKYTAPHVTHHDTAAVPELVEVRTDLRERAETRGVKLTYVPFVMKALVAGLKEFPFLNASLDEENEEIVLKNYYNVGVAVATEAGLMVPVVTDVDKKGLLQLASEINELVAKARDRSITREEMRGGTFTVTNFGAIGGEYATPIINYPEVAILGLGAIEERPVARDGEVVAEPTLPLSLSIDHRVVDGAVAAEFANAVMEYLKNPALLLLE